MLISRKMIGLRFLVRICTDLGMTSEGKEYETKLDKLDVGNSFMKSDLTMDYTNPSKKSTDQPVLPPSFQNIRIPVKQVTPAAYKMDNDLFHENIHDILPE